MLALRLEVHRSGHLVEHPLRRGSSSQPWGRLTVVSLALSLRNQRISSGSRRFRHHSLQNSLLNRRMRTRMSGGVGGAVSARLQRYCKQLRFPG